MENENSDLKPTELENNADNLISHKAESFNEPNSRTTTEENVKNDETNKLNSFKKPIFIGKIKKHNVPRIFAPNTSIKPDITKEINIEKNDSIPVISEKILSALPEKPEQMKTVEQPQLTYKSPSWSGLPISDSIPYEFEVLKNGVIIENINLMSKEFWVFGRLATNDIYMAHPTISRHHAVLQFNIEATEDRPIGFYIYDLGSTHGTFLNKNRIKKCLYVRVQVGHMIKLGNSTRSLILKGPEDDTEPESELTITEMKQKRVQELRRKQEEHEAAMARLKEEKLKREELEREQGVDWGMGEDAEEEDDLAENPYAATNNEELYLDDPKKTLRGFFEREGLDLEYNVEEKGVGQFVCRVELPIENAKGVPITAEAVVKGKKKEAVVQCALEACRLLDRAGVLRQAKQESRKRKIKNWEEDDFYNSDDDEFLDRTGDIQKKRELRKKLMGIEVNKPAETYESLMKKQDEILNQIVTTQRNIDGLDSKKVDSKSEASEDVDSLDAFMKDLSKKPDKTQISKLTANLVKLKQQHSDIVKLINIARPTNLPPLIAQEQLDLKKSVESTKTKNMPLIGKRIMLKPTKPIETVTSNPEKVEQNDNEEEVDSDKEETTTPSEDHPKPGNSKTSRVIGPTKPENIKTSDNVEELTQQYISDLEKQSMKSKKKNEKRILKRKEKSKEYHEYGDHEMDENYEMWLPPDDQKGDGKTKLNEKFGY